MKPLDIVIFGTGKAGRAEYARIACTAQARVICFADNNPRKQGSSISGVSVLAPEQLDGMEFDQIIIASTYVLDIARQLTGALGVPWNKLAYSFIACAEIAKVLLQESETSAEKEWAQEILMKCGGDTARIIAAEQAWATENWPSVIQELEQVISDSGPPPPPAVYARLGYAYRKTLNYERAEDVLDRARALYPAYGPVREESAQIAFIKRDGEKAVPLWMHAWKQGYNVSATYESLMSACRFFGEYRVMADVALQMAQRLDKTFNIGKWNAVRDRIIARSAAETDEAMADEVAEIVREPDIPPVEWWFSFYGHFFCMGRMALAYAFKQAAVNRVVSGSRAAGLPLFYRLAALVESERYAEAAELTVAAIQKTRVPRHKRNLYFYLAFIKYMGGDEIGARAIWDDDEIRASDRPYYNAGYEELIRGKTVAIVGGADVGLMSGDEIDAHDVVIRTNYFGAPVHSEVGRKLGFKATISYYSHFKSPGDLVAALSRPGASMPLKAAVFNAGYDGALAVADWPPHVLTRAYRAYPPVVFMGVPLGTSRIVLDLLPYRPSGITMFNCDFYLGEDTYHKTHHRTQLDPLSVQMLAHHDLLRNLRYTRTLFNLAGVKTDERLRQILDMNDDAFIAELQVRWSPVSGHFS